MSNKKIEYKELINEITEEVTEGIITMEDSIQILRDKEPVFENYCAILDWYYDEYTMNEDLNTPLEEMYMEEEFDKEEWTQMKADQVELKAQYEKDQADLVTIKVKDALTEMKQIQKLFK